MSAGSQCDLVVRAGTVVDGTGGPARTADVAVHEGRVVQVGRVEARGRREIDADGALVTPGWVDVHTHYDGQATWDASLAPSSWLGVTTVVMGNCGVGFAPVHDADHQRLIELMEGVEDIPGAALHEGLDWSWNAFGEYLDAVDARPHDIDVAAQLPHGALRLFVMGERGATGEPASPLEHQRMGELAAAAVRAGALGVTTSRTRTHRTSRGEPTPTLDAGREELLAIARGVGSTGTGVLQVVSDFRDAEGEWATVRAMAEESGRPLSFSIVQGPFDVESHRRMLGWLDEALADGLDIRGQVATRAIGLLFGLQCSSHPFDANPVYRELADLPLAERVARLRRSEVKAAVLAADGGRADRSKLGGGVARLFDRMVELGDPPDYEPDIEVENLAARAAREGRDVVEVVYDLLLGDEGQAMLYVPALNYAGGDLDAVREMLVHERTIPGLGDGGAHVGTICDGSFPTTLLTHWCRDRTRGERLEIPFVVRAQCRDTALALGLADRGLLAPGYRGDLNVVDFERLQLSPPEMHFDLPAGGRRLLQRATGYVSTVVAGEEVYAEGEPTGALPGRLIRGARPEPVVL